MDKEPMQSHVTIPLERYEELRECERAIEEAREDAVIRVTYGPYTSTKYVFINKDKAIDELKETITLLENRLAEKVEVEHKEIREKWYQKHLWR